jgi:hypothetical protein
MNYNFLQLASHKSQYLAGQIVENKNKIRVGKYPLILKFF